ncbi:MAG: hypothetical protein H6732_08295 [Alphaproteobacteria bacterium]|nr:hypothetical protein [Alphaproteobacteria bacterium]
MRRPYDVDRAPPVRVSYRPYYTRWYVHPWYRYRYATTVVVGFGFTCSPWSPLWLPPARVGWSWVPGVWLGASWSPGYWVPARTPPVGFVYVPGFWDQQVYVEGYYRPSARTDGDWIWVDGTYLDDGSFLRGHWRPNKQAPDGYTWEAGFWDGESYVDGFWRPTFRSGFAWVGPFFDADGIFHAGYWAPVEPVPGHVWIPGWFDGTTWVEGYWVQEAEYETTDVQAWEPPEGWHEGWEPAPVEAAPPPPPVAPPAPVQRAPSPQQAPPPQGASDAAPPPAEAGAPVPLGIPVDVDVQDL